MSIAVWTRVICYLNHQKGQTRIVHDTVLMIFLHSHTFYDTLLNFSGTSGVKVCKARRSRKTLQKKGLPESHFFTKFGFDTADNEAVGLARLD